jgi:hypothetical protein
VIAQQISVKVFAADAAAVDLSAFIPIFHRWIQESRMPEHMLIDVADYAHVVDGPGVVLIGHEAHIGIDAERGPLGLLYNRKRDQPGELEGKLSGALRWALTAARALEEDPAQPIRFRGDRLRLGIMSRRFGRGDAATWAAARPAVETVAARLYPGVQVGYAPHDDARDPFWVDLEAPGAPGVAELLARL